MSPQDYCTARITGRPGYYAALFAPAEARAALEALFAIQAELEAIPVECSDPGVARAKYQWWLTDIAEAQTGEPQHPALRALKTSPTGDHVPAALLASLLEALGGEVHDWRAAGESFGRLLAFAGGEHRPAPLRAAETLGAQIHGSELTLRSRGAGAFAGAEAARTGLNDALQAGYGLKSPGLRPHLVLGEVRLIQLRGLDRAHGRGSGASAEPHPLRMLWLAWRTARRTT